jgi:hypothetical protein
MIFGYRDATLSGFASSVNGAPLPRFAKAQRYHPVRAARTGTPALGWN